MIKTQFIAKMVNGKPRIYATAQKDNGAPVYIFTEKETFDAAIADHLIPVGALIVKTYDAIEMAGGPFDAEISEESENAPQNKAVAAALAKKASLTEYGTAKICPVNTEDITEDNGIVLGGFEKNPTVDGTLAHGIKNVSDGLNGYKILAGVATASIAEDGQVEFPVGFFSEIPSIVCSPQSNLESGSAYPVFGTISANGFHVRVNSPYAGNMYVFWIAIGR